VFEVLRLIPCYKMPKQSYCRMGTKRNILGGYTGWEIRD